MSGEYISANTLEEYWKELKTIYLSRSANWKDLTEAEYNQIERSEREDSDNHLNEERLGKDTNVIDHCWYKYLPDRQVAYKIIVQDKEGKTSNYFFQIELKEGF